MAKLTKAAVLEIRAKVTAGTTQRALAAHFGVSEATVSLVVNRKHWAHL